ncbi:MAG: hypothetical protein ACTILB_15310 [Brevibacterium aurantiacum]
MTARQKENLVHEGIDTLANRSDPFTYFADLFSGVDGFLIAQCSGLLIATCVIWTLIVQVRHRIAPHIGKLPVSPLAIALFFVTAILFAILAIHPDAPVTGADVGFFAITAIVLPVPFVVWSILINRRAKRNEEA